MCCRELFPNSRALFMHRDFIKQAKSFYRISYQAPVLCLAYSLGPLTGRVLERFISRFGQDGKQFRIRLNNDFQLGVTLSAVTTMYYLDLRRKGLNVTAIRYEDLVANPVEMCQQILEYCRLPEALVGAAMRGFEVDSQRNSILSRKMIGNCPEPELTECVKNSLNELLMKFPGVPLIGSECIVEGTMRPTSSR